MSSSDRILQRRLARTLDASLVLFALAFLLGLSAGPASPMQAQRRNGERKSERRIKARDLTEAPSAKEVQEASATLKGISQSELKQAELMLWLENDDDSAALLPRWQRLNGIAAFGKQSSITSGSLLRLAALAKLGRASDAAFKGDLRRHLDYFEGAPESLELNSGIFAFAELIDAIYRREDCKSLRPDLRRLIEALFSEKMAATGGARAHFYAVLLKHELAPKGSEALIKKSGDDLSAAFKGYNKHLKSTKEELSVAEWHAFYGLLGAPLEFAMVANNQKLKDALRELEAQLAPERLKQAHDTTNLFTAPLDANLLAAFDLKRGSGLPAAFAADLGVLDEMRRSGGIDAALERELFVISEAMEFNTQFAALSGSLQGASLAALALSGGYRSSEAISEFDPVKALSNPSKRKALAVLLSASVSHDIVGLWDRVAELQRSYYLKLIPAQLEELSNSKRSQDQRFDYVLADAAGIILALCALEVKPSEASFAGLYNAFIGKLEDDLDAFMRGRQTYSYSLCLLAMQQYAQAKSEAKEQLKEEKEEEEKPSGAGESRVKRKDSESAKDDAVAALRKELSNSEKVIAEDLASVILAAHSSVGFAYNPHENWSRESKEKYLGRYATIANERHADNSNSQFAMVGLKAAMVMGVKIPSVYLKHEIERLLKELVETSKVSVKVRSDGSDYFGSDREAQDEDDEDGEGKEDPAASRTRSAASIPSESVKPAGIDYTPLYADKRGSRRGGERSAHASVSSGVISSILIAREALKERKELSDDLDKKIRHAVLQVKAYYAGHSKTHEGALSATLSSAYGIFGILRATVTDGQDIILGRDWRREALEIWLPRTNMQTGEFGGAGQTYYHGLVTLSLAGLRIPVTTLQEDIAKEQDPPPRPPAKSVGD